MSDELKPCPFCWGEAEIARMGNGRQSMQYQCTDCGAFLETGETFIGPNCAWNTRATPPRPTYDEAVERLGHRFQRMPGGWPTGPIIDPVLVAGEMASGRVSAEDLEAIAAVMRGPGGTAGGSES